MISERTVFSLASIQGNWMRRLSFMYALTESKSPKIRHFTPTLFSDLSAFQFSQAGATPVSLGDGYASEMASIKIAPATYRPLSAWMQHYFKQDLFRYPFRYGQSVHGAIFSVMPFEIQYYPKSLYQQLKHANSGADSMEAGYYMERLWRFMFSAARYETDHPQDAIRTSHGD